MITQQLQTKNASGLGNTKEYIVLHHTWTGEGSLPWVLRTLQHGTVSAHYMVDTDGDIYQFNTDDDILWHAWPSSRKERTNLNQYSIGIEIVWPLRGFADVQRRSLRVLVQSLIQKYCIPSTHLIRHKDIAPGRKTDPADSSWADFSQVMQPIKNLMLRCKLWCDFIKRSILQNLLSS
jgi:N-acetylmuramoyl-L-alanine amidase